MNALPKDPSAPDEPFLVENAQCPRCGAPLYWSKAKGFECPRPGCAVPRGAKAVRRLLRSVLAKKE